MKRSEFRALEINVELLYLNDVRGVPKDSVALVEKIELTDDGQGGREVGLCRISIISLPEGTKRMPFHKHPLTIYERDAASFERLSSSQASQA